MRNVACDNEPIRSKKWQDLEILVEQKEQYWKCQMECGLTLIQLPETLGWLSKQWRNTWFKPEDAE
jgi:hypothetical protein